MRQVTVFLKGFSNHQHQLFAVVLIIINVSGDCTVLLQPENHNNKKRKKISIIQNCQRNFIKYSWQLLRDPIQNLW